MNGKALIEPTTFDMANKWLAGRVNVLNSMTSREISLSKDFQAGVRANAFFSAKVAEAHVLDKLREISDDYSRGTLGLAEARSHLKHFLVEKGYTPDDVASGAGNRLSNLASTARLNLILEQNARMAAAIGQREVSMDPDLMERWPYFRYVAVEDSSTRQAHAQLNNLILKKTDPFWNTHTPPWEFNCRCTLEDADEDDIAAHGAGKLLSSKQNPDGTESVRLDVGGKPISVETPASGFVFDVREAFETCDMSRIKDIPMRRAVFDSLRDFSHENPDTRFKCVPGKAVTDYPLVSGAADSQAVGNYVAGAMQGFRKDGAFAKSEIKIGSMSREMKDALGLSEEASVYLSSGSSSYGLTHSVKHHAKELTDGRFAEAVNETLNSKQVAVAVEFSGKKVFVTAANDKTGAFSTLVKSGEGWDNWQVVSAHYPEGEEYAKMRKTMRYKQPPGP